MKVKVNYQEVSWLLKGKINKGPQANKMLKEILGTELSAKFADMQLGSYFYTWELPGDDWKKRSEVLENEIVIVDEAIAQLRRAVCMKTSMADALLSVPNNDFIYYRLTSSGEVEIIFTGWGFKSFKPASGGRMIRDLDVPKEKQNVRIAFMIDEVSVPLRKFNYQFAHMHKANEQLTDSDGFYTFDNPLTVGDVVTMVDEETGKSFILTVVLGQEDYIFDVTQYVSIEIVVQQDGNPSTGENVLVCYNNKVYTSQTDVAGKARVALPYIAGYEYDVNVRDSQQNYIINMEKNYAEFSFISTVVPPPEPPSFEDIQVLVRVTENDVPVVGEQVAIICNGQSLMLSLDAIGTATTKFTYMEGVEVVVLVRNVQQQQILNKEGNIFDYSFESVIVEPPVRNVKLGVEDSAGLALAHTPITIRQGEQYLDCILDENGCCFFAENHFRVGDEIGVMLANGLGESINVRFTLDKEEFDYLLVIGEVEKKNPWKIVLEVILLVLFAAFLYLLCPYFVGVTEGLGKSLFS